MEMRPVRKSSEAPEVVDHGYFKSPDNYMVSESLDGQGRLFPYKANLPYTPDNRPLEAEVFPSPRTPEYSTPRAYNPLSPQRGHDPLDLPPISQVDERQHEQRRNGAFGLIGMILLALVAFLVGGALGGGIGGSMVVKEKAKVSKLQSTIANTPTATVTTTAPGSVQTVILDQAGCPLIDNTTFPSTTPGYNFLQSCQSDILPASPSIDVSTSIQSSFGACLNACAIYNQEVKKGGCVSATWIIFSPKHPERNSMCYLKNATGIPTSESEQKEEGLTMASGLLLSN